MIKPRDLYAVISSFLPLYVPMLLGYSSVKWFKMFDRKQCTAINQFVSTFSLPFLCFDFISRMNPYKVDARLIVTDTLSKVIILFALFLWAKLSTQGSLDWVITLFSLATLPNTIIVGAPLIASMYGEEKVVLLVQLVVVQLVIWINFVVVLYEYRAARIMIKPKFAENICNNFHQSQRSDENKAKPPHVHPQRNYENAGQLDNNNDEVGRLSDWQIDEEMGSVGNPPNKARHSGDLESGTNKKVEIVQIIEQPGSPNCDKRNKKHLEAEPISAQLEKVTEEGSCGQPMEVENSTTNIEGSENSAVPFMMVRKIIRTIWGKLARNPTIYASILGLIWALISYRCNIKKPLIMENSVKLLSNATLGMAMFSLGLFMSMQPRIIACGIRLAIYGIIARFIVGPAATAIAAVAIGLKGTVLKVAIIQASLPQALISFVFANEYDVHPNVLSTVVIFGMLVSLPINILYYIILGLF